MRGLSALVLLSVLGCAPPIYTHVEPVIIQTTVPRAVIFDLLAREAAGLGYQIEYADPMAGVFQVQSRMLGSAPPRRRSRRPQPPQRTGVIRGNLFMVEVADGGVRITAFGRHVRPNGDMHPTLAHEYAQFTDIMRQRTQALGATFVPIPQPPSSYGVAPVQPAQPPPAQVVVPPPPQQSAQGLANP